MGVAGPVGSGKTALIKAVLGEVGIAGAEEAGRGSDFLLDAVKL